MWFHFPLLKHKKEYKLYEGFVLFSVVTPTLWKLTGLWKVLPYLWINFFLSLLSHSWAYTQRHHLCLVLWEASFGQWDSNKSSTWEKIPAVNFNGKFTRQLGHVWIIPLSLLPTSLWGVCFKRCLGPEKLNQASGWLWEMDIIRNKERKKIQRNVSLVLHRVSSRMVSLDVVLWLEPITGISLWPPTFATRQVGQRYRRLWTDFWVGT